MHVAIVGAGFSGLVTASTLLAFGHSVVVFDAAPDVGGLWSRGRRYPGIRTQNSRDTYALSTMRMPASYPLHPEGEQVQAYLEEYVRLRGLDREGILRLGTEVVNARRASSGWEIESRSSNAEYQIAHFDHLVVATGVHNAPNLPETQGLDAFLAAGGRLLHTSQLHSPDQVAGKRVVLLGYGKSACDAAVEIARVAKTTTLVARGLFWKLPTYVGGVLHYSYLLLTRVGEALFPWIRPWRTQLSGAARARPGARHPLRDDCAVDDLSGYAGAVPSHCQGRDRYPSRSDTVSQSWLGQPLDGTNLPVDVIVCGTGWKHDLPSFLPAELVSGLSDSRGNWIVYRHILPIGVANLSFIGFALSLFCPLTSEISALWLAAHLEGRLLALPTEEQRRKLAEDEARWLEERTNGKHAKGTSIVPFSMSFIDELLADLGVATEWWNYFKEWILPIDPSAYKGLLSQVLQRKAEFEVASTVPFVSDPRK